MQISSWRIATLVSATFFITLGWANTLSPAHEQSIAYATPVLVVPTVADTFASAGAQEVAPATEIVRMLERSTPLRVRIPSINLASSIENMGLNDAGEMDVPDGRTDNIGWYEQGTKPGEYGSAVFDAHVYAAFKNLDRAKVGDEIYVDMSSGDTLRFIVSEATVYALDSVPREDLFNRSDDTRLNLITCAGNWDAALNTYDHRLIVYATLAE